MLRRIIPLVPLVLCLAACPSQETPTASANGEVASSEKSDGKKDGGKKDDGKKDDGKKGDGKKGDVGRMLLPEPDSGRSKVLREESGEPSLVLDDDACNELGPFTNNLNGEPTHCFGLRADDTGDVALLKYTGVWVRGDEARRLEARIDFKEGDETQTLNTDFRLLSLLSTDRRPSHADVRPSRTTLVFEPWPGDPDDPDGSDGSLETASDSYGVCFREYGRDEDDKLYPLETVSDPTTTGVTLEMPRSSAERARLYRFRTWGQVKGAGVAGFLTHDPRIVLRAKSGDGAKSPIDHEQSRAGYIQCCPGMPMREDDCGCENGFVTKGGRMPNDHDSRCDHAAQCLHNWDENKLQYQCE